jgi:hypothetical protein
MAGITVSLTVLSRGDSALQGRHDVYDGTRNAMTEAKAGGTNIAGGRLGEFRKWLPGG